MIKKLVIVQVLLVLAYWESKAVFGSPSRRLCNLPYVLYHVSLINSFLLYLLVLDRVLVTRYSHMIEEIINYSQLAYFIYSNFLTGIANVVFWTYEEGTLFAISVMLVYFLISTLAINGCRKYSFRVKI